MGPEQDGGGKLITIEIDEERHQKAPANFKITIDKTSSAGISISYKVAKN
ncbi:MAG: hypothetical protein PVG35_04820 [Desulfobacterales bacterium]